MNCWICEEFDKCPYPVCYEQETTDQIKREENEENSEPETNEKTGRSA